ncbi:MAG: hypothetical protein COC09_05330 [Gammaproteobacteria bacterium]|nr:hypothetical protein [Gammaproteobacteria bacterium]PCH63615.1 MAG: hypothetical protein COC09_05330 [Gammaproteobacteria bacterium]
MSYLRLEVYPVVKRCLSCKEEFEKPGLLARPPSL